MKDVQEKQNENDRKYQVSAKTTCRGRRGNDWTND